MQYLEKNEIKALAVTKKAMECFKSFRKHGGQSHAKASFFVPELYQKEILNLLNVIVKNIPNFNQRAKNELRNE